MNFDSNFAFCPGWTECHSVSDESFPAFFFCVAGRGAPSDSVKTSIYETNLARQLSWSELIKTLKHLLKNWPYEHETGLNIMYIIVPLLAALSSNTPPWDFTPDHTSKCTSSPWPLRTLLYCKLPCMHSSSIGGISTSKIKSITHTWGKLRVQLCLALYYFRFLPCGQNGTHCLLLPRARELENSWAFYIYYIGIFSIWDENLFSTTTHLSQRFERTCT